MISAQENDTLTRVGAGTKMGNLMRQFWVPACLSSELIADGDQMRLMLLGEKLIAFRDTHGRVGIMDHQCPHRCASLFFGRNEEGGIRCAYHGWKFDVDGNCLDQPNVVDKKRYPAGTKIKAYKTFERGGVVYCYMGNREAPPPFPDIEATVVDTNGRGIALTHRSCNWLQALEGDIDTSHSGFLHTGAINPMELDLNDPLSYTVLNQDPEIMVMETTYGTMYCAQRPALEGKDHIRYASFIFPFWVTYPSDDVENNVSANAWVPIDDYNTMIFNMDTNRGAKGKDTAIRYADGSPVPGLARPLEYAPQTNDWHGRWRSIKDASNDYGLDRVLQRSGNNYTGLVGIPLQDQAIQESMGSIVDRTKEHLAASDRMVMLTRRALLKAAEEFAATGKLPRVLDEPELCREARGGDVLVPQGTDWLDAYEEAMTRAKGPLHQPQKAAE